MNDQKDRYNLLAKRTDEPQVIFVKVCGERAPRNHKKRFNREIKFYQESDESTYYPECIYSRKGLLALEKVEANPFRDWIIDYVENDDRVTVDYQFRTAVKNLCQCFENIYFEGGIPHPENGTKSEPIETKDRFIRDVTQNCRRLITSGPLGTSRSKIEDLIASALGQIYAKSMRKRLQREIETIQTDPALQPIHGDLHQDNIMVTNEEEVKVIDWENHKYGFWIDDIAFFCATLAALLREHPSHQQYFQQSISKLVLEEAPKLHSLYICVRDQMIDAVFTNKNFHHNQTSISTLSGNTRAIKSISENYWKWLK